MKPEKWISDTVKEMAKQFEAINKGRFEYVTVEVKSALFFSHCLSGIVLQKWSNDDLVKLSSCVRNWCEPEAE